MFKIMALSKYGREEIDEADSVSDAQFLVAEYRLAFGPDLSIYFVRG